MRVGKIMIIIMKMLKIEFKLIIYLLLEFIMENYFKYIYF